MKQEIGEAAAGRPEKPRLARWPRSRTLASLHFVFLGLIAAVALWTDADWSRPDHLAMLILLACVCELVTIRVGGVHFSASHVGIVLAVVLLGAVPAMIVGVATMLFDGLYRRPSLDDLFKNVAAHCALAALVGAIWVTAQDAGLVAPGSGGFLLGVALASLVVDFLSFLLIACTSSRLAGQPVLRSFKVSYVPLLPWGMILAGLAAGTAHAVVSFGVEPLIGLTTLLGIAQLTLLALERAERREGELRRAIADRDLERVRVASELHDDALQVLSAARQDLADAQAGRTERLDIAAERLDVGIRQLRQMLRDRTPAPGSLSAELDEGAARLRAAGIACEIHLDPHLEEPPALLAGALRELLRNVEKHAQASRVEVRLEARDGVAVLEVRDDGRGFDDVLARRRLNKGHVGLALIRRRVVAAGGRLDVLSAMGEGTLATVRLPLASERVA